MSIIDSLKWRYACKKFDSNKEINDSQINILKEAFNLTPTSFGLQPVKLLIIKDQETKNKFYKYSYFQEQVKTASHILVLCIDTQIDESTIDNYFDLEVATRKINEEEVEKFRNQLKEMYKNMSPAEIENSAIQQTYIILGNLMTVCAVEKIDSCPIEGFIPEKIDEILNLKEQNLKSVLLLPVGFRAEDDFMSSMKKVRKPLNEITVEL